MKLTKINTKISKTCKIIYPKNGGKAYCKTHNCFVFYIYAYLNNTQIMLCQYAEDEHNKNTSE